MLSVLALRCQLAAPITSDCRPAELPWRHRSAESTESVADSILHSCYRLSPLVEWGVNGARFKLQVSQLSLNCLQTSDLAVELLRRFAHLPIGRIAAAMCQPTSSMRRRHREPNATLRTAWFVRVQPVPAWKRRPPRVSGAERSGGVSLPISFGKAAVDEAVMVFVDFGGFVFSSEVFMVWLRMLFERVEALRFWSVIRPGGRR